MEIVVCIKQVPETTDIGWDPRTGTVIREGIPGILNPNDKNALEAALQLKEKHGGTVTAVSMGPPQADEALREAFGMGIDKAMLLSDKKFAGADTLATSYALSLALKKIGRFDLVLCGKESADGMTAQVGPQLAEFLNLPQLTSAVDIEIMGNLVRVKQRMDNCYRVLESALPVVITVEREINHPRIPAMDLIMEAYQNKEVLRWSAEDLAGETRFFGLDGSPTQTRSVYTQKIEKHKLQMIEGTAAETARKLIEILKQKNLV
jgi:electron transfer flavoprotein alpha/beta subunit